MTVLPDAVPSGPAPTNGPAAAAVTPLPPARACARSEPCHPGQWVVLGPRTRAALAAQAERAMGVVLLAVLEATGAPEGAGYRLVLDAAHLEPAPPEAPPPAGAPPG